jgi:hypothetical protein
MRAYAVIMSVAAVAVCGAAIGGQQAVADGGGKASFDEIDVKRLNVVEADGKPRLVLANKEKSPSAVVDGVDLGNGGQRPGMIFYNSEGDESGGLVNDNAVGPDGKPTAYGHLSFDQYKQDQTMVLQYAEGQGRRGVGLRVQDRPDVPFTSYLDEFREIEKMPPGPERDKAMAAFQKKYPSPERVYIGKTVEKASALMLADGKGAPRILLRVGEDGDARIQFLDANGKVTRTIKG